MSSQCVLRGKPTTEKSALGAWMSTRVQYFAGRYKRGQSARGQVGQGTMGDCRPALLEVLAFVNTPSGFAVSAADID